jgi:hypothetical protein
MERDVHVPANRFTQYIYSEITDTEYECLGRFVADHYVIIYNWHPDNPDFPSLRSRPSICTNLKLIAELGDIFSKHEEQESAAT